MSLGPELIQAIAVEIEERHVGKKIRKVDSGSCWVALHCGRDLVLLFSWDSENYGVCSADPREVRELSVPPVFTPPIAAALKSHLVGAEIVAASALNRDRLLRVELSRAIGAGHSQTRFLLLEASGRYSNLILLDEEHAIIESAKHIHPSENRYRSILPGMDYTPPPPLSGVLLDEFKGDRSQLDSLIGAGRPLIAAIKKSYTDAVLSPALFAPTQPVFQSLSHYVTLFGALLDGAEPIETISPLAAARQTVAAPLVKRRSDVYAKKIGAILERQERIADRRITECERSRGDANDAESLRDTGNLILANAWTIPPHASEALLTEWTVEGEVERKVSLDPLKTPVQNAERYFAKYKKKKSALKLAEERLPALYARRGELEEQRVLLSLPLDSFVLASMLAELEPEEGRAAGKGRKVESIPPHRRYEIPGEDATIFCGLSAKGNRYVTFRLARTDDCWLHIQGLPGSHVVLRFGAKPDGERSRLVLELAASCAVYHSRAKDSGRSRVDYTERKQVRAIGGTVSGVTYKEFSTIVTDSAPWAHFLESAEDEAAPGPQAGRTAGNS